MMAFSITCGAVCLFATHVLWNYHSMCVKRVQFEWSRGKKNGGNSFKLTTKNVNCNWNSNENLWKLLWTAFICVHLLKNTQFSPFTAQKCIIEIHSTKNGFLIAADKLKIRQLHGKNASTCPYIVIIHFPFNFSRSLF